MRAVTSVLALVLVLVLVLAPPSTAGDPDATTRPRPHPAPLPTAVLDGVRFPEETPARRSKGEPTCVVASDGDDGGSGAAARPFRTIRRALRAVERGAGGAAPWIVVRAGTYLEGGEDGEVALALTRDGTRLEAAPGAKVTVRPAAPSVKRGMDLHASGATVAGISLEGFVECGISLGTAERPISDVVIVDVAVDMPSGGDGIAAYADLRGSGRAVVDGLLLERVRVTGADQGISIGSGPARRLALRDIVVRNRAPEGAGSGADAIAVESGEEILVNGADVSGAAADGIDLKASRVAVVNAWVHGCGRNGIKLWGGGDIVNALVHDCGADASIVLEAEPVPPAEPPGKRLPEGTGPGRPPARYRVVHATVAFHNRKGVSAYALTCAYDHPREPVELEVASSLFYRNAGGLCASAGTRITVRSAVFFGARGGGVLEWGQGGEKGGSISETDAPAALARAGAASGVWPFRTDPRLADPDAASIAGFRPAPQSPLLGVAPAQARPVLFDLAGAPRPKGNAAIGALERGRVGK